MWLTQYFWGLKCANRLISSYGGSKCILCLFLKNNESTETQNTYMVSIEHKIRWTFHIGSYHMIMKDISWRLHRTKMKLRAYYITLHLQHKILYTFLFLLHSTFAANVWWCIHRRTLIPELLLFLLCADLRNLL